MQAFDLFSKHIFLGYHLKLSDLCFAIALSIWNDPALAELIAQDVSAVLEFSSDPLVMVRIRGLLQTLCMGLLSWLARLAF